MKTMGAIQSVTDRMLSALISSFIILCIFLPTEVSAGVVCENPYSPFLLENIGMPDEPADPGNLSSKTKGTQKAKIYTVFNSDILGCAGYRSYHPDAEYIENDEVVELLKEKCKGVEFIIGDPSMEAIQAQKDELDGLLCLGQPTEEMVSTGLPLVSVYRLWGQWHPNFGNLKNDYQFYKKERKVLTSCLPVIPDKDPSVYEARIDDLANKINLISAIKQMDGLRILVITDKPPLGFYEPTAFQYQYDYSSREAYEKAFVKNLDKIFGTKLVTIPQADLLEKTKAQDDEKSKAIAGEWIREAAGVRGTNESEIQRSAKLYLAIKELMKAHNCGAVTCEGYNWPPGGFRDYLPAQGMATAQLLYDGTVAVSETLLNSLITMHLGYSITGRMALNGDFFIDPFQNIAMVMHCEAPLNPYGDKRKMQYRIRNLPFYDEPNIGGAVVQVNYPVGEKVTLTKIDIMNKKIFVCCGETVSYKNSYPHIDDQICRTKLFIKTNTEALELKDDFKSFAQHRLVYFGDYREDFINLGKALGFEVVEGDKL